MNIQTEGYALLIEKALIQIIETELSKVDSHKPTTIVLNFRDPDYSPETGGYHPVEIMLDAQGSIQYITDFAYCGQGDMAELAKDLDFDFSAGIFQQITSCYPIEQASELFLVWQQNFCAYYHSDVYQVSISQY